MDHSSTKIHPVRPNRHLHVPSQYCGGYGLSAASGCHRTVNQRELNIRYSLPNTLDHFLSKWHYIRVMQLYSSKTSFHKLKNLTLVRNTTLIPDNNSTNEPPLPCICLLQLGTLWISVCTCTTSPNAWLRRGSFGHRGRELFPPNPVVEQQ